MFRRVAAILALCTLSASAAWAAAPQGFQQGKPEIKSSGPMAFGPEGVLFDIAEHPWTGTEPLPAEHKEAAD